MLICACELSDHGKMEGVYTGRGRCKLTKDTEGKIMRMEGHQLDVFASTVRSARKRLKMTQDDLARALGVTRVTIQNWEAGRNKPDIGMVFLICKVLQLSVHDLFPWDQGLSAAEQKLLTNFRFLGQDMREYVNAAVDALVGKEEELREKRLLDSYRIIPLEHITIAAGTAGMGSEFAVDRPEPFFLRKSRLTNTADAVIRVSGPSMEPEYDDGDLVYYRYADEVRPGDDAIIVLDNELYVKRIDNDGRPVSLNPDYPFDFGQDCEITVRGKVLGVVEEEDIPSEEDRSLLEDLYAVDLKNFDHRCSCQI